MPFPGGSPRNSPRIGGGTLWLPCALVLRRMQADTRHSRSIGRRTPIPVLLPVAARRDHMRPMAGRSVVRRAWYRPCMIIERDLDALRISGVRELNAANAFVLEKMVSA